MNTSWVNIWPVKLSDLIADPVKMEKTLSDEEKCRARKFIRTEDALRYKKTRYLTRQILSSYIGSQYSSIQIKKDVNGKPYLKDYKDEGLHFNVSHRDDLLLMAVSNKKYIGVDVEHVKEYDELDLLVNFCFTEQEQWYLNLEKHNYERMVKLFELWTLKEAYVKALGVGFGKPMNSFDVSGTSYENAIYKKFTIENIGLKKNPEYRAAFAVKAKNVQLSFFDYEER